MVAGPAGWRCPECASLRSTALYKIHPARLILAAVAAVVTGAVGAVIMSMLTFWVIFAAPIFGGIVAEAVLRACGRKRGPMVEAIGVGGIVFGYVLVLLPSLFGMMMLARVGGPQAAAVPGSALWFGASLLWKLLGCAIACSACYGRLKYM